MLQCLLRELEALDGSVDIEGSVSYASQDPWIFSGTIKENIIFGQNYDKAWYNRVIECCSLVKVRLLLSYVSKQNHLINSCVA